MGKNYKYALRKTSLGLCSVVIAAVLAGHTPVVLAAEDANSQISIGEKQAHLSKDKKESNLSKDKIKLNNQAAYMAADNGPVIPGADRAAAGDSNEKPAAPAPTDDQKYSATQTDLQNKNDFNYGNNEKEIKDFSDDERYRKSDLEPGEKRIDLTHHDSSTEDKDGFSFWILNPTTGTKDKKTYGIGVKFDPKKERTYAGVTVNSSGSNLNIKQKFGDPESIESAKPGTELGVDNPPVSDQAEATMDIDVKKSKVASLAIARTENDLKLINSINHVYTEKDKEDAEKRGETVEVGKRKPTVFAWKDEYKKDTIAKKNNSLTQLIL